MVDLQWMRANKETDVSALTSDAITSTMSDRFNNNNVECMWRKAVFGGTVAYIFNLAWSFSVLIQSGDVNEG